MTALRVDEKGDTCQSKGGFHSRPDIHFPLEGRPQYPHQKALHFLYLDILRQQLWADADYTQEPWGRPHRPITPHLESQKASQQRLPTSRPAVQSQLPLHAYLRWAIASESWTRPDLPATTLANVNSHTSHYEPA